MLKAALTKTFLVIMIGMIVSGCPSTTVTVRSEFPILPKPEKPLLEKVSSDEVSGLEQEVIQKIVDNDSKLKDYSKKLEKVIDEYNEFAKSKNDH